MDIKSTYIKKWFLTLVIFSVIILLCQIILNNDVSYVKSYKEEVAKSIEFMNAQTPLHPPPLLNFVN
jgi:hypothetical protein